MNNKRTLINLYKDNIIKVVIQIHTFLMDPIQFDGD